MKILFLDQSGKLGGAELSLLDLVKSYGNNCLVGLFSDGPYRELLEQHSVPVKVLSDRPITARKDGNFLQNLSSINQLIPLISRVATLSKEYDLIYANTQKAFVVGAIASRISHRPLVYHLRDILSPEHFSGVNRRIAVTLANRFASLVIANSQATAKAFMDQGGHARLVQVVYNGFEPELYQAYKGEREQIRQELGYNSEQFIVGHFSRLSPWKGQHILLTALSHCPEHVVAVLVGDALFGEQDYVKQLHQQVKQLGLEQRVQFLGFRKDVISLMTACDLVAHTSTAPEPFGRVIIEAMLCNKPVIAAKAGGAMELVENGVTGWLVPPEEPSQLATAIQNCYTQPQIAQNIANQGQIYASQNFNLIATNQQIHQLLSSITSSQAPATMAVSNL